MEEAVRFSAALRLGKGATEAQKSDSVRHTMDIVELHPIANCIVGMPGMFGLSGEQVR